MKLIIAGGREYQLTRVDELRLDALPIQVTEVVSGKATGADAGGEAWANKCGIPVKEFPADWTGQGKKAGWLRNRAMAAYADAVVLFPGNKGTQSMFYEARRRALQIFDWRHTHEQTDLFQVPEGRDTGSWQSDGGSPG